jgi:hypothetical protein
MLASSVDVEMMNDGVSSECDTDMHAQHEQIPDFKAYEHLRIRTRVSVLGRVCASVVSPLSWHILCGRSRSRGAMATTRSSTTRTRAPRGLRRVALSGSAPSGGGWQLSPSRAPSSYSNR